MSIRTLKQIRAAFSYLNPDEVRAAVGGPLEVGLVASSSGLYASMENFLIPSSFSAEKRTQLLQRVHRSGEVSTPARFDLVLYEEGLPCPMNAFTYHPQNTSRTVNEILEERPEMALSLARSYSPFRAPVVERTIQAVARENTLFTLATALPNVLPNLISLPWAIGEFASDTAFLTINQIRMAFMIAAASDNPVGYREQNAQIASIVTGAFGWRAIARELVGKVPLGGGLIPKGAISYAGTYVVGQGLERYHRLGYGYTRGERREMWQKAFESGKRVAEALLSTVRGQRVA
ncbi:MAG: hypothetical protein WD696_03475 [Bryobacteraceae bacterium]